MPDVIINIKTIGDGGKEAKKSAMSFTELKSAIDLASQAMQTLKKGYDFAKEGAQLQYTQERFDRLAKSMGTTGDVLINKVQKATKGTMSEMQAMAAAGDLVGLGLAKTSDEVVRLATVQAGLGMDMNQLVLTLANQTTMRFDQLGVAVDGFDEKVKQLEATGMDTNAAFKEAFLQQAEAQLLKVGNAADSNLGSFKKFEAGLEDLKNEAQMLAADGLGPLVGTMAENMQANREFHDILGELNPELEKQFKWTQTLTPEMVNIVSEYQRAEQYGEAWAKALEEDVNPALQKQTQTAQESAAQNETFLGVFYNVNSAMQDYAKNVEAANAALADGSMSTEEHKAALSDLASAYGAAKDQIVMSILEMKFAADGWSDAELDTYLKIGEARGVFTEEAVKETQAIIDTANGLVEHFEEAGKEIPKNMSLAGAGVAASAESITNSLKDPVGKITALNEKVEAAYKKSGLEIEYFVNIITRGGLPNLNQLNQAATQNCFVAGTLITMADGSQKPIEDVQADDEVTTFDFTLGKNVAAVVGEVFHHPAEQTHLYLVINDVLSVTPNHPLYTVFGWVEAGNLRIGDCLVDINNNEIEIISISVVGESVPTYNLHVNHEDHNYYANGFLAHNKAGGGQVFGPGNGMTDGFLVPMANGEYVVRSSVVKKPGVLAFLEMLNSGQLGRGFATGGFIDKGQSGPVINQQQRDRDRDIPGGGVSLGGIPIPTTSTTTDAALTVPSGPGMSSAGGVSGAAGSLMAGNAASNLASIQSASELRTVNQNLETLISVVSSSNSNLARTLTSNANKYS